jgi:cystathionine beta-lyase/cystathionine gamma-synthase
MASDELDDNMIIAHLGESSDQFFGAVVPPIFMNSLHVHATMEQHFNVKRFEKNNYCYGRESNPTVTIVEQKIAALERGTMALCFSSGMSAITSAIMAVCNAGDPIICIKNIYAPTRRFLSEYCKPKFHISVTYVKGDALDELESAIQENTRLIILESPTSLVFSVCDIAGIAGIARAHGIRTLIDNTYCTPLFQKPLDMGIDLVMHTATKYMGGHSDIIAGVLVSKDTNLIKSIACNERELYGGILGPMEGWLLLRGLRTLSLRLNAHQAAAMRIAQYLAQNPKVKKVNYPGLVSHPQYKLISKQQKGSSGLLSFELDGTPEQAVKTVRCHANFSGGRVMGRL